MIESPLCDGAVTLLFKTTSVHCNIICQPNRKGNLRFQIQNAANDTQTVQYCYFLNNIRRKKSFLFFFFPSSFVSSKGCTLGWTLIKIFFCLGPTSTSRASEKQIQIIGYPGRVLRLGENINIFTTETLLTSQSNIIKSNPFFSLLCGGKLTRSAAFLGKRDL